jgi:HMP-PP phosphatase
MSRPPLPPAHSLLLAFDLDGTLIHEGGQTVPKATRSALARLHALGVRVAIITGRDQAPPDVLAAAQPAAVATNTGGTIYIGNELHTEAHFGPEDLLAVLTHKLQGAQVTAFTATRVYVDLPPTEPISEWLQKRSHAPLSELPPTGKILKVSFHHPDSWSWREALTASHPHLVMTGAQAPYPDFLSVTPAGADKGAALVAIAKALGTELAHTIAFGDSDNDVAMLELAGQAVQVGSLPLLRPHADVVLAGPEALGEYLNALADDLEVEFQTG